MVANQVTLGYTVFMGLREVVGNGLSPLKLFFLIYRRILYCNHNAIMLFPSSRTFSVVLSDFTSTAVNFISHT